jgi:DNA-binding transcriptional MocR family regulator
VYLDRASQAELKSLLSELEGQYATLKASKLNLDLTRGKPNSAQLDLSDALDGILKGNFKAIDSTDARNYGGLDGLPEARALFAQMLGVSPAETLIGGNASLTLMYQTLAFAHQFGVRGKGTAWNQSGDIKFLCPVPGYDRHFAICEELGIQMIPVAMNNDGPVMDEVEALVKADKNIKGIWCVPRFSNPSGIVYSKNTVERIAKLAKIAGDNFRVMWDNAYAIHTLHDGAPELANIMEIAKAAGTQDSILLFGSTSKITYAGAGLAFMAASEENLKHFRKHLGVATIGPDKINQLRHVKFFGNYDGIISHMRKHAELLKPRFDAVIEHLNKGFANSDFGDWTVPEGGYFVSFDTRAGLAKTVVKMADEAGVKLTPAGATFPYGRDPQDRNIRIAPSFPTLADINKAMEVFVVCVKLASVRQKLGA